MTLRSSALALSFSVAEYCAPVWIRSSHTNLVDVQVNSSMRIITGAIKSTPVPWLPVLSNIAPPSIRREEQTQNLLKKVMQKPSIPLASDLKNPPRKRLKSCHPIWECPLDESFSVDSRWQEQWDSCQVPNKDIVRDPTKPLPGMSLNRKCWARLNRFRTGHGICGESQHRWGLRTNPLCSCGQIQSMSHIIDNCPNTKFKGGITALSSVSDEAVSWLDKLCIR